MELLGLKTRAAVLDLVREHFPDDPAPARGLIVVPLRESRRDRTLFRRTSPGELGPKDLSLEELDPCPGLLE